MAEIERRKLSKAELTALMHDYDFVRYVKELDRREEEALKSGRYKTVRPPLKLLLAPRNG
jgi:hypothetical protein